MSRLGCAYRWEWVRRVNSTKSPDTRGRRVEVSISKLQSGKRRPCCFNLAACTDPDLDLTTRGQGPRKAGSGGHPRQ